MKARSATGIGALGTETLLVVEVSYTRMVNSIGPLTAEVSTWLCRVAEIACLDTNNFL